MIEERYLERIAKELGLKGEQVAEAVRLLDKGATVPFIANYRRDITGDIDARRLSRIAEHNQRFIALTNRRNAILENIEKQERMTPELRLQIEEADAPELLEDLYLPFKKQRHPRANTARAQGLEPLADFIWLQVPSNEPLIVVTEKFMDPAKSVSSPEEALEGALAIIAERVTLDAVTRRMIRNTIKHEGVVHTSKTKMTETSKTSLKEFVDFKSPLKNIPGYKLLQIYKAFRKGLLRMDVGIDHVALTEKLLKHFCKEPGSQFEAPLHEAINAAYKINLYPAIEEEVMTEARAKAEEAILHLLQQNTRSILMAVPAKNRLLMGIETGGGKEWYVAVIAKDGAMLDTAKVNVEPKEEAQKSILDLCKKHGVQGIAVGNASNSREVVPFLHEVLNQAEGKHPFLAYANESGVHRYADSDLAAQELPDLETGARNAVSIARRLQDPLKEMLKQELRSIGLGIHVQDVPHRQLQESLSIVATECVCAVGLDLNMATVEELRYICSIQMGTAQNIVAFRKEHGGFKNLEQLKEVAGIGDKTYEQCVGFLRIPDAENPLERTKIHPEFYPLVEKMAEKLNCAVADLMGSREHLDQINIEEFVDESIGVIGLDDIRQELFFPGSDPRRRFSLSRTFGAVKKLEDLKEGMILEGMVTNVTDFGAFVDIGIEQDGLIHKSELINRYVSDPRGIMRVADLVKVEVVKVELERKQVSLSRKSAIKKPLYQSADRPPPRRCQPQQDGAPQDADRQGRPEHGDRGRHTSEMGERSRRPRDDRNDDRPRRPQRGGPRRQERGPRKDGKSVVLVNTSGKEVSLNTPFADQLAALKKQLESGK